MFLAANKAEEAFGPKATTMFRAGFYKGWEARAASERAPDHSKHYDFEWNKHMHNCFQCLQRGYDFQCRQRAALLDAWPTSSGKPLPPEVAERAPEPKLNTEIAANFCRSVDAIYDGASQPTEKKP